MKTSEISILAVRNIKETVRSPISWAFGLALPIVIFIIMQVIMKSIGDGAANVPMFAVSRFTGGTVIFGASFLSMFAAILISSDREGSFLNRLYVSPVKPRSYIIAYMLGILPIAAAQVVTTFIAALIFGLTPTVNILPAMLFALIFSVLFASIGVIVGSALSAKGTPPVCSAFVQVAVLLSGMWFDLDAIGGGFGVFCHVLPFAHGYDIIRYTLAGDYGKVWLPFIVVAVYSAASTVAATLMFRSRMKNA